MLPWPVNVVFHARQPLRPPLDLPVSPLLPVLQACRTAQATAHHRRNSKSLPAVFSPLATRHSPLPLTPFPATHTKNAPVSPFPATHTKTKDLKSASPSSSRRTRKKTHTLLPFPISFTEHGTRATEHVFPLTPFPATHTKIAPVSPLVAAHTKTKDLKSFSCRTYEKKGWGQ